jgi:hypothetical protein
MKTIKKIMLLVAVVVTSSLFVNCSSDSSSSDNNTFYLRCKVDGVLIEFTDPMVINSLAKSISGTNATTGKSIFLTLPLNVGTGTHTITDEPSNVDSYNGSYSDFNGDNYTDNETGTITITSVNADVIQGTFAFTGDNSGTNIVVTEGKFRAENIQ